jgi:hypothetical protein
MGNKKMHTEFWWLNVNRKDSFEDSRAWEVVTGTGRGYALLSCGQRLQGRI